MEEDLRRLEDELQLRDKSISSLQFEKAALGANIERLKSVESSELTHQLCINKTNELIFYVRPGLAESQASLKDERTKVHLKDTRIEQLESTVQELTSRADQQQQTISLLVSEKSALTASVERLEDAESSTSNIRPQGMILTGRTWH